MAECVQSYQALLVPAADFIPTKGHHLYPKEVWTPSGGWSTRPKNWRTNTLVLLGINGVILYGLFRWSVEKEVGLCCRSPLPTR